MIELIGCKAENLRNRNLQTAKILPLPLIPSHQGRGNGAFYEAIN